MGERWMALVTLTMTLLLAACSTGVGATASPASISVAAAADLRFALDDLIAAYADQNPTVEVVPAYGSSGNFFAQIANGAPFDIYFSADIDYPRRLEAAGLAAAGSTHPYAVGRIVLWVRNDSPIDVEALGMDALVHPAARRISIANPEHAPYGRAGVAAIRAAGLDQRVEGRLALGENVSQAAQFVQSGAAEIGVIALSLALAPTLRDEGRAYLVPDHLHPPIEQGAVILERAAHRSESERFLEYVLGPTGREVLEAYGFVVPER
jgi:molybdate transport system substrate-binding protein